MTQRLSIKDRHQLAIRRLVQNLETLGVANMRTLEMKIADAGPVNQRVNPHVLTRARNELTDAGRLKRIETVWFYRETASPVRVKERLAVLKPLYARTNNHDFKLRLGQTLEIAIFRALLDGPLHYVGGFLDLEDHNDSTIYRKEEPPLRFSGRAMPGDKRFDFIAFHSSGPIGIEAKNVREWIYPDRAEVKELLEKALVSNALPVLIARRIPYVTFRLLQTCGVLLFENFNQLYPYADATLAADVQFKGNLGYHDVRVGHEPNPHLARFIQEVIPSRAEEYRVRFERYKDLLSQFVRGELYYAAFAARVRRREQGQPEQSDDPADFVDPNDVQDEEW